jgi:hypothetical protein
LPETANPYCNFLYKKGLSRFFLTLIIFTVLEMLLHQLVQNSKAMPMGNGGLRGRWSVISFVYR